MPLALRPRTHNVLSYAVAAVIFLAVARLREPRFPALEASPLTVGAALWCFHFARRTLESGWLHRYGKPSVPWTDALIEYVYYWGFAAWISWSLSAEGAVLWPWAPAGLALWATSELGNHHAHRVLRALRPGRDPSTARAIPRGALFERVSCPHYFFESMSWLGFAIALPTLAGFAFWALGTAILSAWARQRHLAYRKEFSDYPPARKAIVPFVF